jgi:MFS family permease
VTGPMPAQRLAAFLDRFGIHYAWVVAGAIFLTALTTAGAVGIPGALILPLGREFGWDTAEISSALGLYLALFGLMAPFAAALIERYGIRRVVMAAILLIIGGLAGALVMTRIWQLILFWGVAVGVGSGMTALVLSAIVINVAIGSVCSALMLTFGASFYRAVGGSGGSLEAASPSDISSVESAQSKSANR